ncbi:hypothetical protein [Pelosinus sp. UFO1]|uniref:hypothetical protein n=1 Tax=Pelosinus sp. UFO1 TaxID=484770 RepID=UPI0004D16014|nr:hypothetical protein [Pelosinus sp. UFO1]AIF53403.1 hypothetical protein UFO1_3860 [Pelosinus sp. UFO1]
MSGNSILASKKHGVTGLQIMMLGDVEVDAPWTDGSIGFTGHLYWNENNRVTIISEAIPPVTSSKSSSEKLSDLLMTICLEYPFWNDFRILDFLNKRGISMAMEELRNLRTECGIESREDVCLELMRLYFNKEIELDKKQVQFIERLNPAFRDRDFPAVRPGDLLVYECIFFRRLNKMFYLHLLFDLYNGYAFGKVSRRCSGEIGLKLLQEKIAPFYRRRGYEIHTILHSLKSTRDHWEAEEGKIEGSILAMGIKWLEPKHEFGIIQRFQRDFLDDFFSEAEAFDVSLGMIQPAFDRWMIKYNAACPFHQRRNLLGHRDDLENDRMTLQAECN